MILQQWQARKLHGDVAVQELVKSRNMFALKGCLLVRDLLCEERTASLAEQIQQVQLALPGPWRNFREHDTFNQWI